MKDAEPNEAAGADAAGDAPPDAPPEEAISFSDVSLAAQEMKVPKLPPAARPASRPPPPLPARKSTPPAKPAAAVSAPPRPRPPPRPIEPEVEAEVAPSLPEPVKAPEALPASSRGWMIGAALIVAGSIVYVASPKHGAAPATTPTTTASAAPSIEPTPAPEPLLAEYDAAIADGDLPHASEIVERLALTADKDPRVALRRARVAVVKADRVWLASRLLSPSSGAPSAGDDLVSTLVARELATLGEQASTLSAAALAAAPDDPQAVLARIDALRIAGKLADADALVPRVEAKRDDADVAYTLGALDFVERKSQVAGAPAGLTDLQHASAAAPRLGRAQALLAFMLADHGDLDAAREAARGLESLGHPHPLLEPLRRFIASRSTAAPVVDSTQRPSASIEVPDAPAKPATPWTAAELVARGDAARAKGDRGAAQTFYTRALALNPSSLPALLGRADVEWDTGMRSRAAAHYKQIAERFPQAPPRVKERLATE